jgi:hypothetical protein
MRGPTNKPDAIMSQGNLRARNLDVEGDLDAERLQVTGSAEVYALSWLDDSPPAPLAIVGTTVRSRYVATKGAVDQAAQGIIPIGTIVMWSGSVSSVPAGWVICDGSNGTPDLRGTFPLGHNPTDEASDPLGGQRGADGEADAKNHSVPVPLPLHSHSTSPATGTVTTSSHTHTHKFTEKLVDGLEPDVDPALNRTRAGTPNFTPEGFVTNQTFSDSSLIDFAHPLSTAWYDGEGADKVYGVRLLDAGEHEHEVSAPHTHATQDRGTEDSPRVDVQPPYATVHFIMKVADAPAQPSQCLLPDEPPCEPLDCVTEWGPWSGCPTDATAGTTESRERRVVRAQRGEGQPCPAVMSETRNCPVNCKVGDWGSWSACPANATATSTQTRTRAVTQQAAFGGAGCPALTESRNCPVNCAGTWSAWSACSADCGQGQGTRSRTYTITRAPLHGGTACPASPETEACELACNYVLSTVGSRTITVTAAGAGTLHVLVVGGGGGTAGGHTFSTWNLGGGGAGGVAYRSVSFSVGSTQVVTAVVGAGGAAATNITGAGNNGGGSSFGKISVLGGGAGEGNRRPTATGASGGGGRSANRSWETLWAGPATANQGHAGATGSNDQTRPAGGGGGAGGPGSSGGAGGSGIYFGTIFGTAVGASGTFGRGGNGGRTGAGGSNGTNGTGNGANGGGSGHGSNAGGSGVIILRAVGRITVASSITEASGWIRKSDAAAASAPSGAVLYSSAFPGVAVNIAHTAL